MMNVFEGAHPEALARWNAMAAAACMTLDGALARIQATPSVRPVLLEFAASTTGGFKFFHVMSDLSDLAWSDAQLRTALDSQHREYVRKEDLRGLAWRAEQPAMSVVIHGAKGHDVDTAANAMLGAMVGICRANVHVWWVDAPLDLKLPADSVARAEAFKGRTLAVLGGVVGVGITGDEPE